MYLYMRQAIDPLKETHMLEILSTAYVQLDPRLAEYIALGVTAVVSFLILQVSASIPWLGEYLGQHRVGITVWLTGIIVQLVQARLDQIPESFDSIVTLVMNLIIQVIIVFVAFAVYKRTQAKGSQALA